MFYPLSSKRCRDLSSSFSITQSALVWLALTLLQLVITQTIVVADLFEYLSICFIFYQRTKLLFFFLSQQLTLTFMHFHQETASSFFFRPSKAPRAVAQQRLINTEQVHTPSPDYVLPESRMHVDQ